ncbi:hypothetical protein VUR80DRAFT_6941 [Thermomyces stellatus]
MLVSQPNTSIRFATTAVCLVVVFLFLSPYNPYQSPLSWGRRLTNEELYEIDRTAQSFIDSPLREPYKEKYAELGQRAQQLRDWLAAAEFSSSAYERARLLRTVEAAAPALFPFLRHSPRNPDSKTPLADLRASFGPGTKGIVLSTGVGTLRYAYHLIASVREVLETTLPIEVAYAGDDDLPPADRERLQSRFSDIQFLDVLKVFDDEAVDLREGGWATKAFAALASSFEEVILVDADAVFLQRPEVLLTQEAYTSTGAFLFRDRLLFKGAYKDRHEWWESQVGEPSAALNTSLAYTEGYGEEADSGVVLLDKSRLDVFVGLLHVAWQNSKGVRETTYKLGHGDKESWWFGLELAGSAYAFERHYASIVGWPGEPTENGDATVCSFVIAHLDERGRPFWYNGSLLKNKQADNKTFEVPTHWMVDGQWRKGRKKTDMSCMSGKDPVELSAQEKAVIGRSISLAERLDTAFGFV